MDWHNIFIPIALNESDSLPELVLTHLPSWKVITVSGEDRKSYLQGQLTCDVVRLADNDSTPGAHCDAKGKMWSLFRLFTHKDTYALFQHGSAIKSALAEIKKYSVFSKVDIEVSSEVLLGVMGDKADDFISARSTGTGNVRNFLNGTAVKIESNRWLLLISEEDARTLTENQNLCYATEALWDLCDIQSGLPRVTDMVQNEHIPQAMNLHNLGGVSFNKGCYTGQESVARAKYRGTNKRNMYILKGRSEEQLSGLVEVERAVGQNWRSVGDFITYYQYADGTVSGLIILPNDLEADTRFRLCQYPDVHFVMEALPYSLDE